MAFVTPPPATSPPFQIHSAAEFSSDYAAHWVGTWSHDDVVPDGQPFPTVPDQGMVAVEGSPGVVNFYLLPDLDTSGPKLRHSGPGELRVHLPSAVQGFARQMEAIGNATPDYEASFYTCQGTLLGSFTVSPESAANNSAFLGAIDPAARIGMIGVSTSGGEDFAIGYPEFQLGSGSPQRFPDLPIAQQLTMTINPKVTYLHEGIGGRNPTEATTVASVGLRPPIPSCR